jgi:Ca-activated chloride channel homolog
MRRLATRIFAGTLAMAVLAPAVASAQAPPVFRVDLDMVHVTVTASDAKGRLVPDLRPEDFVVREDGRVQSLQLFAPASAPVPESGPDSEELALNLGMLFDTSESMRDELRLSKESAVRFLENIPRAKDLLLVFFDRDIRLSRYNSENQQGIFERILESEGEGQTALHDSIAVYLSRAADTPGRKVLVVFSDGDDTTSRTSASQVFQMLRASDVVVYPIAFQGERPRSSAGLQAHAFLYGLAEESGGRVFKPHASRELAGVYQSILDELGSQYVLGYVSHAAAHDGRYRKLVVEVKRPGVKLRYRPGYTVPRDEAAKDGKSKDEKSKMRR